MNTEEQLKFIVDLANTGVKKDARAGDWLNLKEDLDKFFDSEPPPANKIPPGTIFFGPPKTAQRYPQPKLVELQAELRKLLEVRMADPWTAVSEPTEIKFKYMVIAGGALSYSGDIRDLFLLRCTTLLWDAEGSETSRLRRCGECKNYFLRVRRQLFCSPQCTDKANKKAWLPTPAGQRSQRRAKKKRRAKR